VTEQSKSDTQLALDAVKQPLRGPFMRWPRSADAVLTLIVFLASIFVSSEDPERDFLLRSLFDIPVDGLVILWVAGISLYWRRSYPLTVLGVILSALIVLTVIDYPYDLFGLPVALYSVGRYVSNDRWSDIGLIVSIAVAAISELIAEGLLEDIGGAFFILFLVWFIGRRIRIRGDYLLVLQERTEHLEREQENEAQRAVVEERTRVARELHDVVAHQVSLMTVQAGAAKTVLLADPKGARRAMEAVENAGRQALSELRHLMGVLRPETDNGDLVPQPGVADIPRLVQHLKDAGLAISLTMEGDYTHLPARVDLSVYRIVQEALTNVLKHAGAKSKTEVQLVRNHLGIDIEVLDDGEGITILPGSGHGLSGMRERVVQLSGKISTGSRSSGGFLVQVFIPIEEKIK